MRLFDSTFEQPFIMHITKLSGFTLTEKFRPTKGFLLSNFYITRNLRWPHSDLFIIPHRLCIRFYNATVHVSSFISVKFFIWNTQTKTCLFFPLWRCGPTQDRASSFLSFLDHTQRRTTVGRSPLDEWSARRRDFYLTRHNTHKRQTSMSTAGMEPTISAG